MLAKNQVVLRNIVNASKLTSFAARTVNAVNVRTMMDLSIEEYFLTALHKLECLLLQHCSQQYLDKHLITCLATLLQATKTRWHQPLLLDLDKDNYRTNSANLRFKLSQLSIHR